MDRSNRWVVMSSCGLAYCPTGGRDPSGLQVADKSLTVTSAQGPSHQCRGPDLHGISGRNAGRAQTVDSTVLLAFLSAHLRDCRVAPLWVKEFGTLVDKKKKARARSSKKGVQWKIVAYFATNLEWQSPALFTKEFVWVICKHKNARNAVSDESYCIIDGTDGSWDSDGIPYFR